MPVDRKIARPEDLIRLNPTECNESLGCFIILLVEEDKIIDNNIHRQALYSGFISVTVVAQLSLHGQFAALASILLDNLCFVAKNYTTMPFRSGGPFTFFVVVDDVGRQAEGSHLTIRFLIDRNRVFTQVANEGY